MVVHLPYLDNVLEIKGKNTLGGFNSSVNRKQKKDKENAAT